MVGVIWDFFLGGGAVLEVREVVVEVGVAEGGVVEVGMLEVGVMGGETELEEGAEE